MRVVIKSAALVIVSLACVLTASGQQNDEASRATLRGIRQIVLVVSFQGDAVLQRFEEAPILKDVQEQVVMAGIDINSLQIFSGVAPSEKGLAPTDYVYLYVSGVKSPIYPVTAVSISIEVKRRVRLDAGEARAVTWKINRLFTFPSNILRDSLRNAIGDELEEFVTAYAAANPR
jgi:hypothetical protein